jgi:hypothetical protein
VVARSFDRCAQSVVVKGAESKTMGRIFFESAGMFSLWGRVAAAGGRKNGLNLPRMLLD